MRWSRNKVKNYARVLENIGTEVLDIAQKNQGGRVPENGTYVTSIDFTEGWFRNSGLYDLEAEWQADSEDDRHSGD